MTWKDFLAQAGLPENTVCQHNPQQQHALLRVSGSDAESFLHAQFSNSVTGLRPGEIRFAAWCNAKGRVWTLLHYWQDGGDIILRLPADQVEDTLKRLRMFVLRSDVQLEPLDWQAVQLLGPDAEKQAEQLLEQVNGQSFHVALPAAWPLHEIWSPSALSSDSPELPQELTALPRILAGIPEVFAKQREEWIPQMLNLDKLGGIDFKKGCYPGQEIVAKLHFKGGLKQRLFTGFVNDKQASIKAGAEITTEDDR
ncbi:MAG: YgfZ/GcvT domain-containing protein, partial [Nevskiales bacterium]